MTKGILLKGLLLCVVAIGISCSGPDKKNADVDFNDESNSDRDVNDSDSKAVYIAIASMTSPKETYIYYSDLINYISKEVGHPIRIKQKETYEKVNELLRNGEVDFAFICSGAFVKGYSDREVNLLVAPAIHKKTTYQAYIITQKDSKIEKFADFENKSFAFTDPLSNTGRLYPLKQLSNLNKTEEDFFLKTVYTYGHDISIQMVNRGIVDGASVHGLIYDYIALHHPERVENVKIIQVSQEFGMPPVVTPVSLDKEKFEKYREVFIKMQSDSAGREILNNLNIDSFAVVGDTIYRSVFQLKEFIENEFKE